MCYSTIYSSTVLKTNSKVINIQKLNMEKPVILFLKEQYSTDVKTWWFI